VGAHTRESRCFRRPDGRRPATTSAPVRVDDMLQNISRQVEPTCAFTPRRAHVRGVVGRPHLRSKATSTSMGAVLDATVTSFGTNVKLDDGPAGEITHQILRTRWRCRRQHLLSFADDRDFPLQASTTRACSLNTTDLTPLQTPGGRCANDDLTPGATLAMAPTAALYLAWMGDGYTGNSHCPRLRRRADREPSCLLKRPRFRSAADAPSTSAAQPRT